jgi:serine phosphatase RsbU (regulator of sigma subunit)
MLPPTKSLDTSMLPVPESPATLLKNPANLRWFIGAALCLAVFFLLAGRVYEAPEPGRLNQAGAVQKAGIWLDRLRTAENPRIPLQNFRVSASASPDASGKTLWRVGFLSPDGMRLYRVTLTGSGDFRGFSGFRKLSAQEPAAASVPALTPDQARVRATEWLGFLRRESGLPIPEVAESPKISVETVDPGRICPRQFLRWPDVEVGNGRYQIEIAFEDNALQALNLTPASRPSGSLTIVVFGVGIVLIFIFGFLPMIYRFFRGLLRREMGSRSALMVGFGFGLLIYLLFLFASLQEILLPFEWQFSDASENQFLTYFPLAARLLIFILVAAVLFFALMAIAFVGGISLAVAESDDWNQPRQLLEDLYRLSRRRVLSAERVRVIYGAGLMLGLGMLALETLGRFIGGNKVILWNDLTVWAQWLAAGRFPASQILSELFTGIGLVTFWILPLTAWMRERWSDRTVGIVLVVILLVLTLPFSFFKVGILPLLILPLLAGFVFVLLRYGWLAAVYGVTVQAALFPLLWCLRHPTAFHPASLLGLLVLAIPSGLGALRRVVPRKAKAEALDLAPPYVRDRYNRERVRQELDVRWAIHQNLIPESGIALRDASIAAEYFHTPEQGRELFVFIPLGEHRLGIGIGEVSGRELQASMLLAVTLATLKSKASRFPDCPAQVIDRVNQFLTPRLRETDSRVQLLYGIADFSVGEFRYCNAGYVEPVLLKNTGKAEANSADRRTQPPVGQADGHSFEVCSKQFDPSDKLVLTSDWLSDLFEMESGSPELDEKVIKTLGGFGHLAPADLARAIVEHGKSLQEAQGKGTIEITTLCVRF